MIWNPASTNMMIMVKNLLIKLAGNPAPPGIELTTSSSPSSIPPLPLTTLLNPIYFQLVGKKKIKNRLSDPPPLKKTHTHKDTTTPIPLTSSSCLFKSKQIKLTKKRKPFSMDQTHDLIILSSLLYESKGRGGAPPPLHPPSHHPPPHFSLPSIQIKTKLYYKRKKYW